MMISFSLMGTKIWQTKTSSNRRDQIYRFVLHLFVSPSSRHFSLVSLATERTSRRHDTTPRPNRNQTPAHTAGGGGWLTN
jgi:hypothetical protein